MGLERCGSFLTASYAGRTIACLGGVRRPQKTGTFDPSRGFSTASLDVGIMMRYSYIVAWSVVGGVNLPKDSQPIELYRSEHCRFVLTNTPDDLLAEIDRGSAVGRLMLKGLFGQSKAAKFPVALAAEIGEIKAERAKKAGAQAVLVVEANGQIDATLTKPVGELEDFIVTFDAVDKQAVARIHRDEIEAMKLAVAFESETPSRFASLAEGTYLINEAGKTVYSISFSMSGEATVSTVLSDEGADRISARYAMLQQANDLESVERLFAQMSDYGTDRLKAFLSGWAALEILVAKAFKRYEHAFLSPLTNAGQTTLRESFLDRIKDVMKDKYRLTDKFLAVAAVLFPGAPDNEIQADFDKFKQLKQLRDSISHGEEFSEKNLPVHELAAMLRKYVLAHIATPNPSFNVDAPARSTPVS
ncbi:MAG: hypothetical protein AB1710_08180 [Pseudomonadota bacterium]